MGKIPKLSELQQAWKRGNGWTAAERGTFALAIYEAKIVAAHAALEITSKILE